MEQGIRRLLEGGGGTFGTLVRGGLAPFGWLYGGLQAVRRRAYGRGWLKSFAAARPVVAVGNLSAGGVGKTPMVAWLAERARADGFRPGVLLRGYRARHGDPAAADEAQWLSARFPDMPVIVNRDRVAGAADAVAAGADVLFLDDGFQHLRLRRDFDLVLLDASVHGPAALAAQRSRSTPPAPDLDPSLPEYRVLGGRCFPAGLLREGPDALRRADALVLTRADQTGAEALAALREALTNRLPDTPVYAARHAPSRLTTLAGGDVPGGLAALSGTRVLAVAGIGRPEAFAATLAGLGARVTRTLAFPDHHAYNRRDADVLRLAAATDAARLVTTEKDAVKLRNEFAPGAPERETSWVLGVAMAVDADPDGLDGDDLWRRVKALL